MQEQGAIIPIIIEDKDGGKETIGKMLGNMRDRIRELPALALAQGIRDTNQGHLYAHLESQMKALMRAQAIPVDGPAALRILNGYQLVDDLFSRSVTDCNSHPTRWGYYNNGHYWNPFSRQ